MARAKLDVDGTAQVDTGVAGVSTAREGQIRIQANNGKTGRHEAQDYS